MDWRRGDAMGDEREGENDRSISQEGEGHFRVVSGWRGLNGHQENILIDTIHDLQIGYTEWLTRQPLNGQSFPPDGVILTPSTGRPPC